MKKCPRSKDEPCDSCSRAERLVGLLNAILRGNDTVPDLGWAAVRFERWRLQRSMEREAARRAALVPKRKPSGIPGPGQRGECCGTTWTGMGSDDDGSDRDIDANGWYSNVRAEYEECR